MAIAFRNMQRDKPGLRRNREILMRAILTTVAVVMLASVVQIDRISYSPLAASASARLDASELRRDLAVAAYGSEGGQDRVAAILADRKSVV